MVPTGLCPHVRPVEIRPWRAEDGVTSLTDLLHRSYARLARLGFHYTAADQSEEVTLERIASGDCYVALDAAGLCGTILFKRPDRTSGCAWYDRSDTASISQFAIAPERQGLGIGGDLLAFAERLAAGCGASELALDTAERARHLVTFYRKAGYRPVDSLRWPGKAYRSLVMSKPIQAER